MLAGCMHACRTATDFGMVRREVMDIVKLMVPTLQQKLYSELNRKLIEVSQVRVATRRCRAGNYDCDALRSMYATSSRGAGACAC